MKAAVSLAGEGGIDRCLTMLREAREANVRAAAADIIGHLDPSGHIPVLIEVLGQEEHEPAQWQLAHALARGGEEGLKELSSFFSRDRNEHRKHEILSSLAHMEEYDAGPFLVQALLSDSFPDIRTHAAELLGKLADEGAIAALTQALRQEGNPQVRESIAKQLSRARERRGSAG
jgi:HEAT repeat protein